MKIQARNNLFEFKEILDRLNISFLLDGGTLLGAYRDKDFCEDDENDIDLTTLDSFEKHEQVVLEAQKKGFEIYKIWRPQEKRLFWNSDYPTSGQIAMIKDGLKIDLMFKRIKNDRAWWTVYNRKEVTYKSVPKYVYQETQKIDFLGMTFNIPLRVEEYLAIRYGDWKTPVHRKKYSCYKSDKCIVDGYEKI